ncbi:hypothetical protein FH972_025751 [Carpinus fangiana]|uniref:Uncharacterized protein n=1 Tax=Carpinus fangiana TaxID=176857 RepID=A0A5N6L207_9ROSI|nr:hypothetical protein FH972_025751 [Carpinus fangiana]
MSGLALPPASSSPAPSTIGKKSTNSRTRMASSRNRSTCHSPTILCTTKTPAGKKSPAINFYPGDIVPDYSTYFSATAPPQDSLAETSKEKDQIFSVNPLPPSGGLGNPKPGEVNTNTLTSHVTLDKESYEKGGALGSSNANAIEASGGAFGVPPVTNTTIPESSLPMGAGGARDPGLPTISSTAGPNTTTSALAGQVPLEPRGVPEVVSESQQRAHVDPEASADRDAVQHKEKVEQELQKKVPEESATSESTIAGKIGVVAAGAGGVVAAGAAAIGLTAGSQSAETKKEIASQGSATSGAQETQGVPPVVTESQNQAHASPEASGQPAVVAEKEQVEEELKKKVPEEPPSSQDNIGSKVAAGAYASSKLPASVQDSIPGTGAAPDTAKSVPSAVADSQHKAHASPEASSNAEAVTEKSAVEKELLSKVPTDNGTGVPAPTATASTSATAPGASVGDPVIADESTLAAIAVANRAPGTEPVTSAGGASALNASASQPAQSIATEAGQLSSTTQQPPAAAVTTPKKRATDSRDVSPMTRGDVSASQPSVTTGTATQSTPTKSTPGGTTTSTADSPASASTDAKKKNRRSFFGRIKDKLKDK